ncbi:DUF4402 domain-containing protein [Sneathiella marina]|uniref:DUF4402 domain-containing protein n=1 Tax=Sneathiella marina TaxID=2950108 RepID=A0ABY4VYD5_9PROT|nr:DUF4402 domain-containing protein [Sneathiella marina]USG59754.1 DUF4402 domain-containing protein [Sneathiella marina]
MNFGTVSLDTSKNRLISIGYDGVISDIDSGSQMTSTGLPAAGEFKITGAANRSVDISIAAGEDPSNDSGATLTMTNLNMDLNGPRGFLEANGEFMLKVGLQLRIPAGSVGEYRGGIYDVTANYP